MSSSTMSTGLLEQLSPQINGGLSLLKKPKAGGIVYRKLSDGGIEILLVHRLKQDDWSFPKGHVENNELFFEAALRELLEETGTSPMLLGRLRDLIYLDGKGESTRLVMYLGTVRNEIKLKKTKKEISVWIPFDRVASTLSHENLRLYWNTDVEPILRKMNFRKSKFTVIYNSKEPYSSAVNFLVKESDNFGMDAEMIDLRKFKLRVGKSRISHCLYFLTDLSTARSAAYWASEIGSAYVVNANAFQTRDPKSVIQSKMHKIGVSVATPMPYAMQQGGKKSLVLKSEQHGIRRKGITEKFFTDPWTLYYEKNAALKGYVECKVWSIGGLLFSDNPWVEKKRSIRRDVHRIQASLGLEVLSLDVFVNPKGDHFIIDINPAPGFFRHDAARRAFILYVKSKAMFFQ